MNRSISPPSRPRAARDAFTLTELLVTLALTSVLLALLSPAFSKAMMQRKTVQCVSNLRYCGQALMAYIVDSNGVYKNWMAGTTKHAQYWTSYLRFRAGYSEQELASKRCTLAKWEDNLGSHYGFYTGDKHGKRSNPQTGDTIYEINFKTHPSPANAIVLADTINGSGMQRHSFRNGDAASRGGIHMRHFDRANIFFYDGHIEGADIKRLEELGITQGFDAEEKIITIP